MVNEQGHTPSVLAASSKVSGACRTRPHRAVEQDVHGAVYGHRELLPMSLLKEGIELLRYDELVRVLAS